jgi:hypothetical protein
MKFSYRDEFRGVFSNQAICGLNVSVSQLMLDEKTESSA